MAQVINRKDFRLPVVIPIVLYNGAQPWTSSKNLRDCFAHSDLFGKYVIDFEYLLIDVNRYKKEDLIELGDAISSVFLLDQEVSSEEFLARLHIILTEMLDRESQEAKDIKNWLEVILEDDIKKDVMKIFNATKRKGENLVTATITRTLAREKAQIRAEGYAEGYTEGKIEILYLERNWTIEDIAKHLHLEEAYVQSIVNELGK